MCHFDAENAFVQSALDEDVLLRMPPGFGRLSGQVVRLKRSPYHWKQASGQWHTRSHVAIRLRSLGLKQCRADTCIFR